MRGVHWVVVVAVGLLVGQNTGSGQINISADVVPDADERELKALEAARDQYGDRYEFERAKLLLKIANRSGSVADYERAETAYRQVLEQHPRHQDATAAQGHLAETLLGKAKAVILRAQTPQAIKVPQRERLAGLFDEAQRLLQVQAAALQQQLEKPDAKRQQLRIAYVQSQFLSAAVLEDRADMYPESSPQRRETLLEAANAFDQLYQKYRVRLAGLYSRYCQARCLDKAGRRKEALGLLEELLANESPAAAVDTVRIDALILAMDIWRRQDRTDWVIQRGEAWLKDAAGESAKLGQIRWRVAEAHYELRGKAARHVERARELSRELLRQSDQQLWVRGRDLLAKLGSGPVPRPATFEQADELGRRALRQLQELGAARKRVQAQLDRETDAAAQARLVEQRKQLTKSIDEQRALAIGYYESAIAQANDQTSAKGLGNARYFLAYLYYDGGNWAAARKLAEDSVRDNPEHPATPNAIKIALAALVRQVGEAKGQEQLDLLDELAELASFIVSKWAQHDVGKEAAKILKRLNR